MNKIFHREKYSYLLMILVVIAVFFQLYSTVKGNSQLVFQNVILYFFRGVPYFDKISSFFIEFPWYWFVIQIFILYRNLMEMDFNKNRSSQLLIRISRRDFYFQQIKEIVLCTLSYLMVILVTIILLSFILKIPFSLQNQEIDFLINHIEEIEIVSRGKLFYTLLLSLFSTVILNVLLWVLYIFLGGNSAYLMMMVYYLGAIFIPMPLFLANFLMLVRTLQPMMGLSPLWGFGVGGIAMLIAIPIGLRKFQSLDIL